MGLEKRRMPSLPINYPTFLPIIVLVWLIFGLSNDFFEKNKESIEKITKQLKIKMTFGVLIFTIPFFLVEHLFRKNIIQFMTSEHIRTPNDLQ